MPIALVIVPVIFAIYANTPSGVDLLTKENAEFELSANGDFLIFWAVLLFTCLVGSIELFQLVNKRDKIGLKILYFFLFLVLLVGIVASISRSLAIIRENYEIMTSSSFDEGYKTYILNNQSIFDNPIIRSKYFEVIPNTIIVIILSAIFAFKTGFSSEQEQIQEEQSNS